jgi:hypothetical protein
MDSMVSIFRALPHKQIFDHQARRLTSKTPTLRLLRWIIVVAPFRSPL